MRGRGTSERPGTAMDVDDDGKGGLAFWHGNVGAQPLLQLDRLVVGTDLGLIAIEFLEVVDEPGALLLDRSLPRLEIKLVPAPNNVLFLFRKHARLPPSYEGPLARL